MAEESGNKGPENRSIFSAVVSKSCIGVPERGFGIGAFSRVCRYARSREEELERLADVIDRMARSENKDIQKLALVEALSLSERELTTVILQSPALLDLMHNSSKEKAGPGKPGSKGGPGPFGG